MKRKITSHQFSEYFFDKTEDGQDRLQLERSFQRKSGTPVFLYNAYSITRNSKREHHKYILTMRRIDNPNLSFSKFLICSQSEVDIDDEQSIISLIAKS